VEGCRVRYVPCNACFVAPNLLKGLALGATGIQRIPKSSKRPTGPTELLQYYFFFTLVVKGSEILPNPSTAYNKPFPL